MYNIILVDYIVLYSTPEKIIRVRINKHFIHLVYIRAPVLLFNVFNNLMFYDEYVAKINITVIIIK